MTKNRIVSAARAKDIVEGCKAKQTYFVCHNSPERKEIVCKTFYDRLGHFSQMVRISERLNAVEFLEQNDIKLTPFKRQ